MSQEKLRDGTFIFSCETCPEAEEPEHKNFAEAWESLKSEGWKAIKAKDGKWFHMCPSCVEESNQ